MAYYVPTHPVYYNPVTKKHNTLKFGFVADVLCLNCDNIIEWETDITEHEDFDGKWATVTCPNCRELIEVAV